MSLLLEAEKTVSQLSAKDLGQFRDWFAAFDNQQWDKEIENDIAMGKLSDLATQALLHHQLNQTKPI